MQNRIRLVIGAFDCPMCFTRFREVIDKGKISDTGGKSPFQPPQMCETAGERAITRVRCPYCNTPFDENLETCPHCGARN